MPEFVTEEERSLLAAEFVLGTLDAGERTGASALLDADEQFRRLVSTWERRLGDLHLMVEPVEPGPEIWGRVKARFNGASPRVAAPIATPEIAPEPANAEQLAPEASELEKLEQALGAENRTRPSLWEEAQAAEPDALSEAVAPLPETAGTGAEQLDRAPHPVFVEEAVPSPPVSAQPLPEPVVSREESRPLPTITPDSRSWPDIKVRRSQRRARRGPWPAVAALMTLVAVALAGLIAAWRYAPDRLPTQLHPAVLLNIAQAPPALPAKRAAPPDSLFEE